MKTPPARGKRRASGSTAARPGAPAPPLAAAASLAAAPSLAHPAFVLAAVVAAACILITVSFVLFDTDMWQHFAVGRAIWELHAFPTRQLWTWPTYGAPDVNASWGFRFLIWPIWHGLGIPGLFAWRWLSTLAVFGLLWMAARRMGARGMAPLLVMSVCALSYRQRSQIRPETLISILLAAQIWIHESWRARESRWAARARAPDGSSPEAAPADHRAWLILIAWAWANAHISYWIGLTVQFIYLAAEWPDGRTPASPFLERIGLRTWRAPAAILLASAAISFVNPWGWRALWQPFEYFIYWRHEDVFKSIGELAPIDWSVNHRNLLPELLVATVLLLLWRSRTRALDRVEWLMIGLFVPLALLTQRFIGFLAVVVAPFLARDLDAWVRSRRFASTPPWRQALVVAALCVATSWPEWTRISMPLGIAINWLTTPVRACDFMLAHDVRGKGLNQFAAGGYLVYRFWPDRSRLPFMDIHQAGTRQDRYYYAWAQQDSSGWRYLDEMHHFDYAVLFTHQNPNDHLIDRLDADTTHWALVFSDDAAALFLRRDGPYASESQRLRYGLFPAGKVGFSVKMAASGADSTLRRRLEAEFKRAESSSEWNSRARLGLAILADQGGREAEALQYLDQVLSRDPLEFHAHEYRAEIELAQGDARGALADARAEIRIQHESGTLDLLLGRIWQQMGDTARARASYRRALELAPGDPAPRDSLAALEAKPAR